MLLKGVCNCTEISWIPWNLTHIRARAKMYLSEVRFAGVYVSKAHMASDRAGRLKYNV